MKLFIAAHSQDTARCLMEMLVRRGHEVTSRWIVKDRKFHLGAAAYSDEELAKLAVMDEEDVRAAEDGVVLIAEPDGSFVPGGKHVETGMALALGRPVFVIGRRENVFHWHPNVSVFGDAAAFAEWLR